ncbi:MAG: hypothetical protein AAF787_04590 [Chloroflexota bacterium]
MTRLNLGTISLVGRLDSPAENSGSVFSHAFSIDGTRLATLNTQQLVVWDLLTGEIVFAADRGDAIDVFYSPDKTELYLFNRDGAVDILDGETGFSQTFITTHQDFVDGNAYTYDPDNGLLAVVAIQGEVRVWNAPERQAIANIQLETAEINSVVLSDNPGGVATGSESGAVEVWDWQNNERLTQFQLENNVRVNRMALSVDALQLAVATDEDIRVWDVAAQALQHVLLTGRGGSTDVLAYAPDGGFIVNSGTAEAMNVWNPGTGDLAAAIEELGGEPTAVAFHADENLMLASVFQGEVSVWDLDTISDTGIEVTRMPVDANIIDVGWSPDRRALALFDTGGSIYMWGIPQQVDGGE